MTVPETFITDSYSQICTESKMTNLLPCIIRVIKQ